MPGRRRCLEAPARTRGRATHGERDHHAEDARHQGPPDPAGALPREVESEAEAEESVEGTDDPQVLRAGGQELRMLAEQAEPSGGMPCRGKPDDFRQQAGRQCPCPGGLPGAAHSTRSQRGADDGGDGANRGRRRAAPRGIPTGHRSHNRRRRQDRQLPKPVTAMIVTFVVAAESADSAPIRRISREGAQVSLGIEDWGRRTPRPDQM